MRNFQQQVHEWVEVYYECLLKLSNCLQVKATNVLLVIIFRTNLKPYFKITIVGMTRDTFIKHKEIVVICEESALVIANYNILIIRPRVQTGCTTYNYLYYY